MGSLVYGFTLYVLHRSLAWRARAALAKGVIMAAFGLGVLLESAFRLGAGQRIGVQLRGTGRRRLLRHPRLTLVGVEPTTRRLQVEVHAGDAGAVERRFEVGVLAVGHGLEADALVGALRLGVAQQVGDLRLLVAALAALVEDRQK